MKITFYFAPGSNCSQRILWALEYKALHYESINVADPQNQSTFKELSPFGYVPIVTINGEVLSESMAIAEYIDELNDSNTLFPGDPITRAKIREVCEFINSTIHPAQNSSILNFLAPELEMADKLQLRAKWIVKCLDRLRPRIWIESKYAVGKEFSLADIFLFEICQKVISLQHELNEDYSAYLQFILAAGHRPISEPA